MKIGRVTISDRASAGLYEDRSGPEIERRLSDILGAGTHFVAAVIPDEAEQISSTLRRLADSDRCDLIVTTGGTGISARDVTPEATRAVLEKELPGFGEIMRMHSFRVLRTAILSRATAGTRGRSLLLNLPGQPAAVAECLAVLADAILEGGAHLRGEDPHAVRAAIPS
jgi:molybdopterin adenylyltransferase